MKDHNKTPRAIPDHWRFTPNLLDSGPFAFSSLMNQPSGYYTPTASAMSIACHTQAGDLHTPGMGFQLGTPLSIPTSDGQILSTATAGMHAFHSHLVASNHYPDAQLFAPQQSYAPSSFLHQDSGFDHLDASHEEMPVHDMKMESGLRTDSNLVSLPPGTFDATMAAPPKPGSEKCVTTPSRAPLLGSR